MNRILFIWFLMSFPVFAQDSHDEQTIDLSTQSLVTIVNYRHRFGDHVDWSNTDLDDSDWPRNISSNVNKIERGVHWIRKTLILEEENQSTEPVFFRVMYIQSAYEIFWDGIKIGTNGHVGETKKDEKAGRAIYKVKLDAEQLTPGRHILALRISNFRSGRWFAHGSLILGRDPPTGHLFLPRLSYMFRQVFFTGIFFTATIVGFALFFGGGRYRPYLIFACICLLAAIWRGFLFLLEYLNLNTTFATLYWPMNHFFFDLMTAGIILFLLVNFRIPNKRIHSAIVVFLFMIRVLAFSGILPAQFYLITVTILPLYVLTLLILSISAHKSGSWFALAGYVFFVIPQFLSIFQIQIAQNSWMFALTVFMTAIILSISRQLHEQVRQQKALDMRSQSLENELLKKTIQPHFVMNTLQSIQSLSKRNPEKAVRLIEAFADEFRVISKVASAKEITMAEEIRLCESHLKLMGFRWDASYALVKEGLLPDERIPPLIFHTLIENGLTHSYKPKENGTFRFTRMEKNGMIRYRIRNDGSLLKQLEGNSPEEIGEGMGFKYVKARLEESYPGNWSITYGMRDQQWEVAIEIRNQVMCADRDH